MADILEVFFITLDGGSVVYEYHTIPWLDKSVDPNFLVDRLWADEFGRTPSEIHKHCIRHSSSWRWEPGADIKTYFVYSDEFCFPSPDTLRIALDDPRFVIDEREPFQKTHYPIEEVLAHAVMHLALLVQQRDHRGIYTQKLTRKTIAKFKQLFPAPAGKLA